MAFKELILDLPLQAFYTSSVEDISIGVKDYVVLPNYTTATEVEDVYVGGDVVKVGTDIVQINAVVVSTRDSEFSFLVYLAPGQFTVARYTDDTFYDWKTSTVNGIDFSSYFVTGYELFKDSIRKKQATYLICFFERTEDGFINDGNSIVATHPSSCLIQSQWNWTNTSASNKWGTQFQAYRYNRNYIPSSVADDYDTGDKVIVTKNKLRGNGRALSLYFQSEAGKDMKIYGWAIPMTSTGVV